MKFEMQDFQVNHLAFLYLEFHSEAFAFVEKHIVFFFEKDGKHIVINPWKQNYYYYCRFQIYQGDSGVVWSKIQSFVLLPHKIGLHREMMNDANRDGPTLLPSNSKICQHGLIIQAEIQETRGMIQKG